VEVVEVEIEEHGIENQFRMILWGMVRKGIWIFTREI